uniref:Polyketide cyclase dehydrase and lipid transport protein n=1 Tax=Tetraselmis sp. GSL018 TaxID=582737 RepID=A0A061R4I9_9CHLO|mmetsp:Transcript_29796/g.71048  ORF Transcript_29796/g.71048 Transcript_29796/m.71048 type:complete len:271 (-) Transcript_29796:259-1071(-)
MATVPIPSSTKGSLPQTSLSFVRIQPSAKDCRPSGRRCHSNQIAVRFSGHGWKISNNSHTSRREFQLCAVTETAPAGPRVEVEKGNSRNSRQLFAGIEINAPSEVVWNALTNYAHLHEFIPGLKENRVMEQRKNGVLLLQVGEEDLALGVKFTARVVLNIEEHPRGLPAGRLGDLGFPVPKTWAAVNEFNHRDISFELVEGDFKAFNGIWRIQPGANGPTSCRLSYSVLVKPSPWMPVRLVEGRIRGEIAANLNAIRCHAEAECREEAAV